MNQYPRRRGLIARSACVFGALAALVCGCASDQATSRRTVPAATTQKNKGAAGATAGNVGIILHGRSVTEGWFKHWGVPAGRGARRGRFQLLHQVFEPYQPHLREWPRQMGAVAERFSRNVAAIQFKLCFVDFKEETNLSVYFDLVREIYDEIVGRRKKVLIIGNALPAVKNESNAKIVAKHREYNRWLGEFAKRYPGRVLIFDQHLALADPTGYLKPEYAVSDWDSHLNQKGYAALDRAYFAFLGQHL
jgi:hypothetical protein